MINPLDDAYAAMDGSPEMQAYADRHGIQAASVLTIYENDIAEAVAAYLTPRIEGKTVIEVGGGIGLLALHLGVVAKHVFCLEANPVWMSAFAGFLLKSKPRNVSYLFGAADEFEGLIRGDVALFCTHSGLESLRQTASRFAPIVIDVYGEIIAANPDRFDALARRLRESS